MDRDRGGWLDESRAVWDSRADRWDATAAAHAATAGRAEDLSRTVAALRLAPGARLLDAGCGSGQWAVAFAELGCRVVGVDLAPAMIARARERAAAAGVEVEWRSGDLTHLPEPLAVFDAVHARVSLQFVPDPAAALREFRRVLRPGGRLYASIPGALSPIYRSSWRRFLDPADLAITNGLLPWELERILEALGWRVLDGWGEFGESFSGEANPFTAEAVAGLDRRLQQAAATTWAVIAG